MQDFEVMMQKGISLMREYYENLSILASPNMDTTALRAVKILCPFRWDKALKKLRLASKDTAYGRYRTWYNENRKNQVREREELRAQKRTAEEPVFGDDEGPAYHTRSRHGASLGL